MANKTDPADFPYDTRLDVLFKPLEKVDLQPVIDAVTHPWFNQTLAKVNGSVVRLGVMQGEYHWHKHEEDDEFFYCIEGLFCVDLEDRVVELRPRQGFTVPKGVVHRTRAPERSIILMIENAGIIPTGD
ncbi:MAG TPA: cupin domain-containing protein [Gammaproteobacteria bacterium]